MYAKMYVAIAPNAISSKGLRVVFPFIRIVNPLITIPAKDNFEMSKKYPASFSRRMLFFFSGDGLMAWRQISRQCFTFTSTPCWARALTARSMAS